MRSAEYWIDKLKLEPHPEGGYFGSVYRSDIIIQHNSLPQGFHGDRPIASSIYYLLRRTDCSRFHRLQSDELWHFYDGNTLVIYTFDPQSNYEERELGIEEGIPQLTIRNKCWMAAKLKDPGPENYILVGCTVSPGFDFE
ncbi:MAG: cupin domain-containing protein, partial [Bacteroidetes bacterium]|nr:cupin domain-containing protein [Bacteroidota bacterium]